MTDRPLVLGFDTSGPYCACALLSGTQVLAHETREMRKGQAERLMSLLQETLAAQNLSFADVDLFAVATGPGNFTGIRISVSAARGLRLATGRPAMGVSCFEIMRGAGAAQDPEPMLVSLQAPRDYVYLQEFDCGAAASAPTLVPLEEAGRTEFNKAQQVLGFEGSEIARQLNRCDKGRWQGRDARIMDPALTLSQIALSRYTAGERDPDRPVPLYAKAADAAPASDPPPLILP